MIKGKYHLAKVRPTIDVLPNTAFDAGDVLFDWYAFEIPRGGCAVKSLNVIVPGTDGACVTGLDIELLFATSVKGVAPSSLGDPDAAITKIAATACKNNIIGHKYLDASVLENSDELGSYNIWTQTSGQSVGYDELNMVLEGDPNYTGTTQGYQTIWVAGIAIGATNFATNCLLDGAILTGAAGAQTLDVANDADADDIFAVGDELLAAANDGSSVQKIGTITSLTADAITIDAKDIFGTTVWSSGALADDDEICFRRPLTFNIGLEY